MEGCLFHQIHHRFHCLPTKINFLNILTNIKQIYTLDTVNLSLRIWLELADKCLNLEIFLLVIKKKITVDFFARLIYRLVHAKNMQYSFWVVS